MYQNDNIFAKILRGEIPTTFIYENDHVVAFHDIRPAAPVHILILPKGQFISSFDFYGTASKDEIFAFSRALSEIIHQFNLEKNGYRILSNHGKEGGQEVPHFHMHLLGGKKLPHIERKG